jgi:hypothetical protein
MDNLVLFTCAYDREEQEFLIHCALREEIDLHLLIPETEYPYEVKVKVLRPSLLKIWQAQGNIVKRERFFKAGKQKILAGLHGLLINKKQADSLLE